MTYPIKTLAQLPLVLKAFRKEKGLTQAAMAEKLGITQQSYAYFEANPATANLERLFTVLRLLNVGIALEAAKPAAGTVANASLAANEPPPSDRLADQGSKTARQKPAKQAGRVLSAKAKPLAVPPKQKESW